MKTMGIEKEIDKLGRILIPKYIREAVGFELNQSIEIIITHEGLLLRKISQSEKSEKNKSI